MKSTLVIGVGWLGRQIVSHLDKHEYSLALCSRSQSKLNSFENKHEIIKVTFSDNKCEFSSDVSQYENAVICLPPFMNYPYYIDSILQKLSNDCRVVFMSSIGIYEDATGVINETNKVKEDHQICKAEQIIKTRNKYVILRLGGLIGPERHPIFKLIDKRTIQGGNNEVNLVHSNDICNAVFELLKRNTDSCIFNLVYPYHPTRFNYYNEAANHFFKKELQFDEIPVPSRKIDGLKIVREIGFNYSYSIDNWNSIHDKD